MNEQKFLYILIGECWENKEIYYSLDDAKEASINNPSLRVEVFIKNKNRFVPMYSYYKNGVYFDV
jgi:hypothetical protein